MESLRHICLAITSKNFIEEDKTIEGVANRSPEELRIGKWSPEDRKRLGFIIQIQTPEANRGNLDTLRTEQQNRAAAANGVASQPPEPERNVNGEDARCAKRENVGRAFNSNYGVSFGRQPWRHGVRPVEALFQRLGRADDVLQLTSSAAVVASSAIAFTSARHEALAIRPQSESRSSSASTSAAPEDSSLTRIVSEARCDWSEVRGICFCTASTARPTRIDNVDTVPARPDVRKFTRASKGNAWKRRSNRRYSKREFKQPVRVQSQASA